MNDDKVEDDHAVIMNKEDLTIAFIPSNGIIMNTYKKLGIKCIPVVKNGEITVKHLKYDEQTLVPVLSDEVSGALYIIIDYYTPHKLFQYVSENVCDSYRVVNFHNKAGNEFPVSFLIRHLDDNIFKGYLAESKELIKTCSKKYMIVPQELLFGLELTLNNNYFIKQMFNKVYNLDKFVSPSIIYDKEEDCDKALKKGALKTEVLLNDNNGYLIF